MREYLVGINTAGGYLVRTVKAESFRILDNGVLMFEIKGNVIGQSHQPLTVAADKWVDVRQTMGGISVTSALRTMQEAEV